MAKPKKPSPKGKTKRTLRMTSIRLDPEIVRALKKRAGDLGVGWQTVLKMIVTRYVNSEL